MNTAAVTRELLTRGVPQTTLRLLARVVADAKAGLLSDAQISALHAYLREVSLHQVHPLVRSTLPPLPEKHELGSCWRAAYFAIDPDAVLTVMAFVYQSRNRSLVRRRLVKDYLKGLGVLLLGSTTRVVTH